MSTKTTKEISSEIINIANNYIEDIQEQTDQVIEKTVDDTRKKVINEANYRKGKYRKGIKSIKDKDMQYTIYATGKRKSLTHLLERGHKTRNGMSRTHAKPHWEPADDWVSEELPRRILKKLK